MKLLSFVGVVVGAIGSSGCRTSVPAEIVTEAPTATPNSVVEVAEPEAEPESAPESAPESDPAPEATVVGSLDRDIIRRVVQRHVDEIRDCYNAGLTKDPELEGRVTIDFIIGGEGRINSAVVHESTLKDLAVPKCIVKAVEEWVFPEPSGGSTVTVRYPFNLVPG